MEISTVKIVYGDGYAIINESDYDPKTQKLFVTPKEKDPQLPEKGT